MSSTMMLIDPILVRDSFQTKTAKTTWYHIRRRRNNFIMYDTKDRFYNWIVNYHLQLIFSVIQC